MFKYLTFLCLLVLATLPFDPHKNVCIWCHQDVLKDPSLYIYTWRPDMNSEVTSQNSTHVWKNAVTDTCENPSKWAIDCLCKHYLRNYLWQCIKSLILYSNGNSWFICNLFYSHVIEMHHEHLFILIKEVSWLETVLAL